MKRGRIREQVKRILLKSINPDTVCIELRVIRSKNAVPWAITGLTSDGTQHTSTREPCEHSMQVVGYFVEALERLDREMARRSR